MRTRLLAVLTTALLLVGVAGGVAEARSVAVSDARGDMWRTDFEGDIEKAPDTRTGDVRRAVFAHGRSNIVIHQRFVDLRHIGEYSLFTARIENGAKRYREVRVEAGPRGWQGTAKVFDRHGNRVGCRAGHRIDYVKNVMVMSVPRACLNTPNRVRVTARSYWAHEQQDVFLMDNPHNRRAAARTWTRWLRAG